jgi:hypothetical protein
MAMLAFIKQDDQFLQIEPLGVGSSSSASRSASDFGAILRLGQVECTEVGRR